MTMKIEGVPPEPEEQCWWCTAPAIWVVLVFASDGTLYARGPYCGTHNDESWQRYQRHRYRTRLQQENAGWS
jgi:hypothetical protein